MNRHDRRATMARLKNAGSGQWDRFVEKAGIADHPLAPVGFVRGYLNSTYSVQVMRDTRKPVGMVTPVGIRRHDQQPITNWNILQRIKDEVIGPDCVAVQVFPAKSDIVDSANMYWLWVLPAGSVWTLDWEGP